MPEMSGEELHMCLKRRGACPPVIFMSDDDDIPMAVRSIKNGALDFLRRPFESERLIKAISNAIDLLSAANADRNAANDRLYALSPRELEIFAHVVRGEISREIARELAISVRTVKAHRATIRRKLGTRSVAEWTRIAAHADFSIMPITPATLCGRGGARWKRLAHSGSQNG
jgi:FixJ family two-component response regulator